MNSDAGELSLLLGHVVGLRKGFLPQDCHMTADDLFDTQIGLEDDDVR